MAQNLYGSSTDDDLIPIDELIPEGPDEVSAEDDIIPIDSFIGKEDTPIQRSTLTYRQLAGLDPIVGADLQVNDPKATAAAAEALVPDLEPGEMTPEQNMEFEQKLEARKQARLQGQAQEDLRAKMAATDQMFSGELPELTPEEMQQHSEQTQEQFMSDVKFTGESLVEGATSTLDLLHWAIVDTPTNRAIDKQIAEAKGEEYNPDYNFTTAAQDSIKAFYGAIGQPAELQEAESFGGVFAKYTLQNFGALGPIAAARNQLKTWGNEAKALKEMSFNNINEAMSARKQLGVGAKFFDDFLKYEAGVSVLGGTGAATFWSAGNSEEQKAQLAEFGNLLFALSPDIVMNLPVGVTVRSIFKAKNKVGTAEELWAKHDKHIMKTLSGLVPEDQLPKLEQRIAEIRQIQQLIPEFKPSVGNVIGTKEARQIQGIFDTKNIKAAQAQYRRNKDAVESLVRKFAETTDPAQKEVVASALRMLREESIYEADRLRNNIGEIQEEILRVSDRGADPDAIGEDLREAYGAARNAYQEHMDELFKNVDPEGTAQFDVEQLKAVINGVTVKGGLGQNISPDMQGYNFLTNELPKYLNDLSKRTGSQVSTQLGMARPPQTIDYNEMYNIRKQLGREASRIRNTNTGSRVPDKLDAIKAELDNMVENKMLAGDKEVAGRHFQSIDLWRDMYIPRMEKRAAFNILRMDGKEIPNDKVAETLWSTSRDNEVTNLKQLQDIFEESGLNIKEPAIFAAAKNHAYRLVEDHAVRDLDRKLKEAAASGRNMFDEFNTWKRKNETKIKAFPFMKDTLDEIGQDISLQSMMIEKHMDRIDDLSTNVINKYVKIDPTQFVQDMTNKSPLEVRTTFRDLFHRNGMIPDFDPEVADLRNLDGIIDDIKDPKLRMEAKALRDAVSESTTQYLLRRSIRTDGSGFDSQKLLQSLDGFDEYVKSESLQLLLNEKNRKELNMLRKAGKILGDEISPQAKIELDNVSAFFQRFGVSIPSISSRIYAHQLGKVGPVYIALDTSQRVLRGISKMRSDQIYMKTMYNLDGLEELIKIRRAAADGDKAALQELEDMAVGLRGIFNNLKQFVKDPETYKKKLIKELNASKILHGVRVESFLDSLDDLSDDDDGMLGDYLKINDEDTNQPSRVSDGAALQNMFPEEETKFQSIQTDFGEVPILDEENQPLEQTEEEAGTTMEDSQDVVEAAFNDLFMHEGAEGDTTGAAVTGKLGVTQGARDAVAGSEDMTDEEVAKAYLGKLAERIPEDAPFPVKLALIDSAYNLGEGMFNFRSIKSAMANGDWLSVGDTLLRTATIGGAGSKGLAKRRAIQYNKIAQAVGSDIITTVVQEDSGVLRYMDEEGNSIMSYRPKNGRHKSSKPGSIEIPMPESNMVAMAGNGNQA